jgi:hypothetical protein
VLLGFLTGASMRNLLENQWVGAPQQSGFNNRLDA